MTRHLGLAAFAALLFAIAPVGVAADQRARTVPPAAGTDGGDARKAEPREAEPRKAEPRPAPAPSPPAAAPAPKPKIEPPAPAREASHQSGPVVVSPTIVVPSTVGGVTVGKSFTVGSGFSVGHDQPEPETSSRGGGPGRRDRSDRDRSIQTVVVPYPVYVPVQESDEEVTSVPADTTPSIDLADVARPVRLVNVPRSYFTFTSWYNATSTIVAGRPVALPPPSTFTEGNISATVAETQRDTNGTTDTVSVVDYAKDVGGVAFSVTPADAGVYVDGRFVGSVGDYSPQREPLLLRLGVYDVELRAQGYATARFKAYVTSGEVIPFSGTMARAAP